MKRTDNDFILVDHDARVRAVNDLDSTICVEAGAGTGKTTILVDRYLSLIKTGRALCGEIVAITFTEKAAGEMKTRLREKLSLLACSPEISADERARFAAAGENIENAQISTIHAFASSVLREYPIEAGVDPDFRQIDEIDRLLFLEEMWDEFLSRTASSREPLIQSWVFSGGNTDRLRSLAFDLYSSRSDRVLSGIFYDDGEVDDNGAPEEQNGRKPGEFPAGVIERAAELKHLVNTCCNDPVDRGAINIKRFLGDLQGIEGLSGRELEEFLLRIAMPAKNSGAIKNWDTRESCDRQKEIIGELRDIQSSEMRSYMDRVSRGLEQWLGGFIDFVDERKEKESILDFDDLLICTRKLLDDDSARRSLRDKYRYFLVDEFQDTDPLQAEIIILLSASGPAGSPVELEEGRLFIVGDPKQSIYRFRKADVEIYEKIKHKLTSSEEHLDIFQNFRSVPGITGWVNGVFSGMIRPPESGFYQPRYQPVDAARRGEGEAVISLEIGSALETSDKIREAEGETVARFIKDLVEKNHDITDPEDGAIRPVRYGDIALLYRGTTGIEFYEDPLRDAGIPYIVEGGKLYYTRQEIRDLASAVWAIEDPYDTLAIVSILRSPLFGFSDEELFLYKRRGGRFDYLEEPADVKGEFEDLASALQLLGRLHFARNDRGPAGTLDDLLRETGYLELSVLGPHGAQQALNIQKALQNARTFGEKGYSYRSFARWLRDQEKVSAAESESPALDESEDAVRLLTIHKSKGLQFPVVIIVNLVQRRYRAPQSIISRGKALSINLGNGWETSDFSRLLSLDRLKDEAESIRLLYVAATRARDILVIPETARKDSYYSLIEKYIVDGINGGDSVEKDQVDGNGVKSTCGPAGLIKRVSAGSLPELSYRSRPFSDPVNKKSKNRRSIEEMRNSWRERTDSALVAGKRKRVFITPSSFLSHEAAFPAGRSGEGDKTDPLLFGSAFHRIMELVRMPEKGDITGLAGQVASRFGIGMAGAELGGLVEKAMSSPVLKEAGTARTILREVPFTLPFFGREFEGRECPGPAEYFVDGRIDLLFEKGGIWTIVDYKTDDLDAGMVDARFDACSIQGSIYALAAGKAGLDLSGGIVFYFARPGVERRIKVTASLLENTAVAIKTAANRLGKTVIR